MTLWTGTSVAASFVNTSESEHRRVAVCNTQAESNVLQVVLDSLHPCAFLSASCNSLFTGTVKLPTATCLTLCF